MILGRESESSGSTGPVSVLLAAFGSPYISEAIASVRAQSRNDWELLVLDDANLPSTRAIVSGCGDGRIRYVGNGRRLGPALNYRQGIAMCRHELVAFINHDDIWEPTLLEKLGHALQDHPEAVVAFSDHSVIDSRGEIDEALGRQLSVRWGRSNLDPGLHQPFLRLALVNQAIPIAQCALWRKSAISPIPKWTTDRYDYWVQIALAMTGKGAVYLPERLARFRVHAGNLGGDSSLRRRIDGLRFYTLLRRSMDLGEYEATIRVRQRRAAYHVAKWPARAALNLIPLQR